MKRLGQVMFPVFACLVIAAVLGLGVYEQYCGQHAADSGGFEPAEFTELAELMVPEEPVPEEPVPEEPAPEEPTPAISSLQQDLLGCRCQRDESLAAVVSGGRYAAEIDECWGSRDEFVESFVAGFSDGFVGGIGTLGLTVQPRHEAIRDLAVPCETEAKAIFAVAYARYRDAGVSQWDAAAAAAPEVIRWLQLRVVELLEADGGVRLRQLVVLDP